MITSDILRRVVALALPKQKMLAVLGIIADMDEHQMSLIDRHHEPQNEPHRGPNDTDDTERKNTPRPLDKERSPTPSKETNPLPHSQNAREIDEISSEFENHFWLAYPHKVGKPDAAIAFRKARLGQRVKGKPKRAPATLRQILDGLKRYIAAKPTERDWLNPATFLNQERWADMPATAHANGTNGAAKIIDWPSRVAWSNANGGDWPVSLWGDREDVPKEFAGLFHAQAELPMVADADG